MHMCQRCRTPTKTPVKRRRVMVETPSPQPKRRRPCECPPSSDSSSECPPSPSPDSNSECPPPSADDIAIDRIQSILNNLKDGALESTLMKIADRVKVTIVGKTCSLKELIHAATTAEAAPQVHAVIADECIRLRVGRREYTKVIVPAYRKIRDAIKWVDVPGAEFCPRWGDMKKRSTVSWRRVSTKVCTPWNPRGVLAVLAVSGRRLMYISPNAWSPTDQNSRQPTGITWRPLQREYPQWAELVNSYEYSGILTSIYEQGKMLQKYLM